MTKKVNYLFLFQLLAHLSVVPMLIYGEIHQYVIAWFVFFLTGSIGMSGTYHRLLSHKSFVTPKWFEYFGSLCGTLGGTGSTIAWCAVHREHHRYTDKEQDPHSPLHQSWWKIQFLSMFHNPHIRYVPDLLRSSFHQNLHKFYWLIHLIYFAVLYNIDPFAVVYAYLFPSFILWHAGSSINTFSHMIGYQTYDSKDSSTNHWLPGIFMWGEGWHNNHHYDPMNMRFGKKWYEIDITYYVLKLLNFKSVK